MSSPVDENIDVAPFTDLSLTAQEQAEYLDLLLAFYDAQERNHGAESQVNASLEALSVLDDFISAAADKRGLSHQKPHIERVFNEQAADGRFTINDHLDSIERKWRLSMQAAQASHGNDGVMDVLRKGGAQIIDSGLVLVRTNPARAHLENAGGDGETNVPADKFAQVINLLLSEDTRIGGQRIYMDDLVIQRGKVDPAMVRNRPYDVIQIPKINKEIAVCDLKGQAMFVSPQIHGPKLYATMDKLELEHVMGMARITSHAGWEGRMLDDLNVNAPQVIQKVDVADFAKKQKNAKMPLSPEIVGLALLKYAADHEGKMASNESKDSVPDMPGDTWGALQVAGRLGMRKMPKGMDLAAVKRYFGWNDAQNKPQTEKIVADIAVYEATGAMPPSVMGIEEATQVYKPKDLSPQIVGLALLKYAAEHEGEMALTTTKDPVPDMPDKWKAIDSAGSVGIRAMPEGMDLPAVKRYYGWNDAQNKPQPEKIAADIAQYQATGAMPKPVISIEKATTPYKPKDLSPEIVGLALLKYAVAHDGKMATVTAKDPVPDMLEDTWRALDAVGRMGGREMPEEMTLSAVKRICGWMEEGKIKPAGACLEQLNEDIAYFKEHGEMSDDLKERIARGVADHIAKLDSNVEPQDYHHLEI